MLFHEYHYGGNVAIQLVDERDGQPVATATVNPEYTMKDGYVCIKDYSENEGMLEALMNAGIVSEPISFIQMGFVKVPVCVLLVDILQDEPTEEDYEQYKAKMPF